jgi:hypothetical protein
VEKVIKMNNLQHFFLSITAVVFIISFAGSVYADIPVHAAPGLTVLSVATTMDVQGIATSGTDVSLQLGSDTLNSPPLENGGFPWRWGPFGPPSPWIYGYTVNPLAAAPGTPVPLGEVQYTAEYHEAMTALSGRLSYQKSTSVITGNKTVGDYNIASGRMATFIGEDGGRMSAREDILLDGAGAQTTSASHIICPFASTANPFLPPFCNIVMSGSSADISTGSISTSTGVRFIASSAEIPVTETYLVSARGVTGPNGNTDASGTITAFIKAHLQEGTEQQVPRRFITDFLGFTPVKAEDLSYAEISTASGTISSFTKNIQYQSGIRLV